MRLRSKIITLAMISGVLVFSGCGDKKNLEVKPYPKYMGMSNKIIYDNKSFWDVDLKDDMNDYSVFLKRTFNDIEEYNKRWAERYGVADSKNQKINSNHKEEEMSDEFDYDGIINEQY